MQREFLHPFLSSAECCTPKNFLGVRGASPGQWECWRQWGEEKQGKLGRDRLRSQEKISEDQASTRDSRRKPAGEESKDQASKGLGPKYIPKTH